MKDWIITDDINITLTPPLPRISQNSLFIGFSNSQRLVALVTTAQALSKNYSVQIIVLTKALQKLILEGIKELGMYLRVDYLWHWRTQPTKTDVILVYGIEDLEEDELQHISKYKEKFWVLFAGTIPSIYSSFKKTLSVSNLLNKVRIYELPEHILADKCHSIESFVKGFINSNNMIKVTSPFTYKPLCIQCKSLIEEFNKIEQIIKSHDLYSNVAILFLRNSDVEKAKLYFVKKLEHLPKDKLPLLMTYHQAKDMIFDIVFMCDCDINDKDLICTTMLTAKNDLYILSHKELPECICLYDGFRIGENKNVIDF